MNDVDQIRHQLTEWLEGLDSGDLNRMIKTVDPEAVICNEHQPTGFGIEAIREKYGPRIATTKFESGFDIQHLKVFGDIAMMVGRFTVKATNKETGQVREGQGRLLLVYRKHADGWRMLIDMDNNDESS